MKYLTQERQITKDSRTEKREYRGKGYDRGIHQEKSIFVKNLRRSSKARGEQNNVEIEVRRLALLSCSPLQLKAGRGKAQERKKGGSGRRGKREGNRSPSAPRLKVGQISLKVQHLRNKHGKRNLPGRWRKGTG